MKKITLLFLLSITFQFFSQVNSSTVIGSELNYIKQAESDMFLFGISVSAGYFIGDSNLEIGSSFDYENSEGFIGDVKATSLGVTPYVKKYFFSSEKLAFTLTGAVSFLRTETKSLRFSRTPEKNNNTSINFTPGLTYFLSKKLALTANLGSISFSRSKLDIPDVDTDPSPWLTVVNLSLNNVNFGFNLFL